MKQPAEPKTDAKRRRCDNCPRFFELNTRIKDQRFCSAKCRKEFHRYGSAGFLKLREVAFRRAEEIEERNAAALASIEVRIIAALNMEAANIKEWLAARIEKELDYRVGAVR